MLASCDGKSNQEDPSLGFILSCFLFNGHTILVILLIKCNFWDEAFELNHKKAYQSIIESNAQILWKHNVDTSFYPSHYESSLPKIKEFIVERRNVA